MPLTLTAALSDTVGITDSLSRHLVFHRSFSNTVGITDSLHSTGLHTPKNTVGITDSLAIRTGFLQYDTWRPVTNPENTLVLVCRTPVGEHDSYTGATHLTLWTIQFKSKVERQVVTTPATNGYGWVSYSHPEWAPVGREIVVAAETAGTYKLVRIDATTYGD